MRLTRIYSTQLLAAGNSILLDAPGSNHVLRVLRLKIGDPLLVFDGDGCEYLAEIISATKQSAQVLLKEAVPSVAESPLHIHLGQAISRSEKMDYTLQKAVELGVKSITPLLTERGNVKLAPERIDHKLSHWQQVIISACEQSGRAVLPSISRPQLLSDWLQQREESCKLLLHPRDAHPLKTISPSEPQICLLVGAEGGFSDTEVQLAQYAGFETVSLGPRILRTETAAPAAISMIQCLWGDMG